MKLENYLTDIPNLHSWDRGKTWNTGGFDAKHLRAFYTLIKPMKKPVIVETGAGNSTIIFLLAKPAKVISIAPDNLIFERINNYCLSKKINLKPLIIFAERSEIRLPLLFLDELKIDVALIDGCHGWPSVFVDFCYLNAMLRLGGFIIVDDIQLHSVAELDRLLQKEKGFTLQFDLGKVRIYRKNDDAKFLKEWSGQPYISEMSKRLTLREKIARIWR